MKTATLFVIVMTMMASCGTTRGVVNGAGELARGVMDGTGSVLEGAASDARSVASIF